MRILLRIGGLALRSGSESFVIHDAYFSAKPKDKW